VRSDRSVLRRVQAPQWALLFHPVARDAVAGNQKCFGTVSLQSPPANGGRDGHIRELAGAITSPGSCYRLVGRPLGRSDCKQRSGCRATPFAQVPCRRHMPRSGTRYISFSLYTCGSQYLYFLSSLLSANLPLAVAIFPHTTRTPISTSSSCNLSWLSLATM
jgi:hypothetical protein